MKNETLAKGAEWGKRIDFHTHILPEMDDGSSSVEMSIQMLQASVAQGVVGVVVTPHFYPLSDSPNHFLGKRKARIELLKSHFREVVPQIVAGAEVHYFEGITAMRDLPRMRIGISTGLLIEMPMCKWSNRMAGDIAELNRREEYQVILAHAERYLPFGNLSVIRELAQSGVMMQINSSAFQGTFRAQKALKMLDEGLVHILGSDCHNMSSRSPNLDDAYAMITKKRGESAVRRITNNAYRILSAQQGENKSASPKMEFEL